MDNKITITDENGIEHEAEVILTFESSDGSKQYVLFAIADDPEGNVYAYSYDDDGNMDEVDTPEEWEMCNEVLGAFMDEADDEEE